MSDGKPQFDFGRNWKAFSERALTAGGIEQAKKDFIELLGEIDLTGQSFLDIGFGQGLTLLTATSMGAQTVGCEIDPICTEILQANQQRFFPELSDRTIPIVIGSILDDAVVESLRAKSPDPTTRAYQVVHSWGVLHHTGAMERAICNAAALVAPHGYFIVAIYDRHWSSPAWRMVKWLYHKSPAAIRRLLVGIFYPVIYVAKWFVTGRSPLRQARGMDFYYDVVDWVGGYPYECATTAEATRLLSGLGFKLERIIPRAVPTGCNQFVFRMQPAASLERSSDVAAATR